MGWDGAWALAACKAPFLYLTALTTERRTASMRPTEAEAEGESTVVGGQLELAGARAAPEGSLAGRGELARETSQRGATVLRGCVECIGL